MYGVERFFANNPIDRYGIGTMSETLPPKVDGSMRLSIQRDSPGADRQSKWLPCPQPEFFLVLRKHQPEQRMYGTYIVPSVIRTRGSRG